MSGSLLITRSEQEKKSAEGRRGGRRGFARGMLKYGEGRGKKYAAIKHSCNKTACNNRPAYFKKLICRRTNCLVSRDAGEKRSASLTFSASPLSDIFFFFFFLLSPLLIFSLRRVVGKLRVARKKKKRKKKQRGKARDSYSCLEESRESLL